MTEEEAKTKWCFAAVASHTDPRTGFQPSDTPDAFKVFPCIGSACMAWRWHRTGAQDPDLPRFYPDVPQGELDARNDVGFCGLAGKP